MSDVTEKDVREIKWRVEGIEKSVDLLVRANRAQIIQDLMEFFGRSRERVNVFLNIDGEKTVNQIAQNMQMKPPNVSRRITELQDEGLVEIKKFTRQGYIYEKTEKVRILNLEKILRKKFSIVETPKPVLTGTETGETSEQ
jgi:predicted transcriptional regulator